MRFNGLKCLLQQDKERWGTQSSCKLSLLHAEYRLVRQKRYCDYLKSKKALKPLSVVVGGIKIGNHAKIGAGAIIVNDVPDNAVMICDKAHNIAKSECL